jgi:hypothetical protein
MELKAKAFQLCATLVLLLWSAACAFASAPLTEVPCRIPGVSDGCIAWGDFDNDGYLDVLVGGNSRSGPAVQIYRNDGNGNFNEFPTAMKLQAGSICAWIDYNGDGYLDVVVASNATAKVATVYLNDHGRSFSPTTADISDLPNPAFAYGDFDNDGLLDLASGASRNSSPRQPLWKYHKNKSGAFDSAPVLLDIFNSSPAAGDWDNDGLLDLAATGVTRRGSPRARLYQNVGSGALKEIASALPNLGRAALAWGDYDNDGSLDLIMTGLSGKKLVTRLFRNTSDFGNVPPLPPGELTTSVSGQLVTLSWASATDVNQPGGLTYNLRIGTAPGTSDVLPCLADPLGGTHRVPRIGNLNQQLNWSSQLPQGVYYWSVQAIDHSYAASEFALEQRFEIEGPPVTVTSVQESNSEPAFFTPAVTVPPAETNLPPLAPLPAPAIPPNEPPALPASIPTQTTVAAAAAVVSRPPAWLGIDPQKRLYLSGAANRNYRIESSTDLAHWETLGNIAAEPAPISFVDPNGASSAMKFYRAVIQPLPPKLATPQFGETFNFQFASEPGQSYEVEASANLHDWEPLITFTASGTNVLISDPASIELPQRFYRIKLPQ